MTRWKPPMSTESILTVLHELAAAGPRTIPSGRGTLVLPGPTATDIARQFHRYDNELRPALTALVADGHAHVERVGAARCFLPGRGEAPTMRRWCCEEKTLDANPPRTRENGGNSP